MFCIWKSDVIVNLEVRIVSFYSKQLFYLNFRNFFSNIKNLTICLKSKGSFWINLFIFYRDRFQSSPGRSETFCKGWFIEHFKWWVEQRTTPSSQLSLSDKHNKPTKWEEEEILIPSNMQIVKKIKIYFFDVWKKEREGEKIENVSFWFYLSENNF